MNLQRGLETRNQAVDTSRQAVRRVAPGPGHPEPADLPCYEMDELTDFQVSTPMPARRGRPVAGPVTGDREITEQLGANTARKAGRTAPPPASSRRKPPEPTQPIAVTRLAPPAPPPGRDDTQSGAGEAPDAGTPPEPRPRRARVADIAAGDVLCGRYVVEEKVAHRGMGHVYKALDRHRQAAGAMMPWVALKFARRSVGRGDETTSLLRQEFLKLCALHHPNIVSVFDLARDDDFEFIVMEWLSGETLGDLLARTTAKRIALDKAVAIVRSTARALAHAHELGIVHGDVKPSNIFLTNSRVVKVLDFGSSGASSAGGDPERNWATRAYASRDVLRGGPPQPHDDVFALGVTAYCLLSGERPFGDLDALAASTRRVMPHPLPEDALERWPAVRHALAFDAVDRSPGAGAFLQEFDDAPAERPTRADAPGSPTVAYGALAATLLASVVWWSVQSTDGLPPDAETALADANRALAEGRLIEPEGDDAWSLYSAVLEAEPGNRLALDGMEEIAERLLIRAREAIAANDAAAARAQVALARRVSPDHFGIPIVEDLIASRGRDTLMRARHAAETDIARAEALLGEAEALLPADYPALAAVREEIAVQRVENRVGALLRQIDERILAERLSVPTGDSALDLLQQARELAPGDPRIEVAADRIMTALVFQAMFATSNGDLERAGNFLEMARSMGLPHLALARAEYELAKARRDALAASRRSP